MDESFLEKAVYGIVLIIVLFNVYATLIPTGQTAGNTLNTSGAPLGSLFASNGVVWIIVMAALLIVIVRYLLHHKK